MTQFDVYKSLYGEKTPARIYDITGPSDRIRMDIVVWLKKNLPSEDYHIINSGYLLDTYELTFKNEPSEMMFKLVWGIEPLKLK